MYVDDELFESLPHGAFTYTGDGIYYTDTGELFATFPYKDLSIGIQDAILIDACCIAVQGNPIPIHWGKTYIDEQDGSTCIITGIHIYRVYPSNTFNTNIVFDSYNSFATGAIVDYIWGTISDDGTKITINNSNIYNKSETGGNAVLSDGTLKIYGGTFEVSGRETVIGINNGDAIIEGIGFYVNINTEYEETPEDPGETTE